MILQILQIIVAILLIVSILLQAQGSGIGTAFGGGGEVFRSRQRMEKVLVAGTILFATALAIISIILLRQ